MKIGVEKQKQVERWYKMIVSLSTVTMDNQQVCII